MLVLGFCVLKTEVKEHLRGNRYTDHVKGCVEYVKVSCIDDQVNIRNLLIEEVAADYIDRG